MRETAVAFLGIDGWKFVGPIFVGDTIFVEYELVELRDSRSRPTQAVATFDVKAETGWCARAAGAKGAPRFQSTSCRNRRVQRRVPTN